MCIASLVGPVNNVLSAVNVFMKLFYEQIKMMKKMMILFEQDKR